MPRMWRPRGPVVWLLLLPRVRVGEVRLSLPVLERRARGTTFLEQPVRSLLNPPESTGMAFWSANPYLGCEFGCVYCYARFAHRFALERAQRRGRPDGGSPDRDTGARTWKAFEHEILVKRRADFEEALDRDLARLRRRSASSRQMLAIPTNPRNGGSGSRASCSSVSCTSAGFASAS